MVLPFIVVLGVVALASAAPKSELWPKWQGHDAQSQTRIDHGLWNGFLKSYLISNHPSGINRVRYVFVSPQDRKKLEEYIAMMQQIQVSSLNRREQKACWINLYNALTVRVILDHYPVKSIRDIDISPGWFADGPWGAKLLKIEGEAISLDDIEHKILRPIWKDNRVHYAVNCASLGCPNLQPEAFTGDNTERLLGKSAREYVNHQRGAQIEKNRLVLSSIYKWFQVDFGGSEEGVMGHLLQFGGKPLTESLEGFKGKITYDYDWRLNE
jgi:hypothetical protein